ncbi:MAG: DUF2147 domain-containing protein [Bacteroidota bacterium]
MSRFCLLLLLLSVSTSGALATPESPSPVGVWRVISDQSGEVEALVRISERDGVYEGRITGIFPRPGVSSDARCERCSGTRKDQPVNGMLILSGLRRVGQEFKDGEILDPDTGELYRCKLNVSDDNRRLFVRGYIGLSLFGRTQTWLRE